MFSEKPEWVRHEGIHIFSIDIQPGALRFATGGGDHKVRIWNMKCVGSKSSETPINQRLLATLRDHFGSVNCVRWAKHGRFIASGSDDKVILIHERKPGLGTTEFGSGEPPDAENWKVITTFRGHTADVVDLSWSPDDLSLASSSLDNTVHIWSLASGICTAVLRGHSSFIKGIAWDPIGSFIASQSDDKTVIIWRTSDWSLAHKTDGHWSKSVGSTFFRRLAWSPCGHFVTTTHGFQKPRHSAPVLERGEWSATFDFLGHNAPVVVVKFNNSMFRKNASNGKEVNTVPTGWSNGTSNTAEKDMQPYNVIAIGSQDRTITVWTTASARPLIVAKHYFSQSVVDLSWSPDGYSLFACSLDGTIAIFDFEAKELGHKLSDAELDELKRSRYGDVRGGRQSTLAESPAQLLLEQAAAKQKSSKKPPVSKKNEAPLPSSTDAMKVMIATPSVKSGETQVDNGKKSEGTGDLTNKGISDLTNKGTGDLSNKGTGDLMNNVASVPASSPVKQREYRRPDGRKRIIPEAVGSISNNENISQGLDFHSLAASQQKDDNMLPAVRKPFTDNSTLRSGLTARANINESLVIEKTASTTGGNNDGINLELLGPKGGLISKSSCEILSVHVLDSSEDEESIPLCLEARPAERVLGDIVGIGNPSLDKETQITCRKGTKILWSDRMSSKVTVLAGNANFWAVGCEDGCLHIYTKCGRRAMPAMMVGSAAIFIDCDENWKLLVITKKGLLYVWDIFKKTCLLHDSLSSLVISKGDSLRKDGDKIKVISARFSRSGSPLVVLSTRHAFLFDMDLMCWIRVADDCFPASNFSTSISLGSIRGGELAELQIDVGKFMARKPSWSRVPDDGVQTRGHLETQLASSLALKSPIEYRQCLLSYVRFLAREADESRLREVCEGFIGPPIGMAESTPVDPMNPAWDPFVLGMKKHKLLKEDILPAMASNRKVQRLLNEFMDILSEYDSNEITANANAANQSYSAHDGGSLKPCPNNRGTV